MNGKNLFRALEYVDDRYLDIADAAAQDPDRPLDMGICTTAS